MRTSWICTYLRHLKQDLPDAEVVQSALETSLSKEVLEVAVLAELGLNIKMVLRFPRIAEIENVFVTTKSLEDVDFSHLVLTVLDAKVWLLRLFDSPNISKLASDAMASSWTANNWLRDTIDLRKLAQTNGLDTLETGRQGCVDIVGKETRHRGSKGTRANACTKVHARVSWSSGCSRRETV